MNSPLHSWNVTASEAIALQKDLRERIQLVPFPGEIRYVAGGDISFNKGSDVFYAGLIILHYPSLKPYGHSLVITESRFPYIPGLLSFREMPPLLQAWDALPLLPDVVLLDGHGLAHPRRMGIASHFGLWIDKPTIGCAKKLLVGQHGNLEEEANAQAVIYDHGQPIGTALRTRTRVKPMYISPGNLTDFDSSLRIVQHCLAGYRMPEPTRQAHLLVNRLRKGEVSPGVAVY